MALLVCLAASSPQGSGSGITPSGGVLIQTFAPRSIKGWQRARAEARPHHTYAALTNSLHQGGPGANDPMTWPSQSLLQSMSKEEATKRGSASAEQFLRRLRQEAESTTGSDPKLESVVKTKAASHETHAPHAPTWRPTPLKWHCGGVEGGRGQAFETGRGGWRQGLGRHQP